MDNVVSNPNVVSTGSGATAKPSIEIKWLENSGGGYMTPYTIPQGMTLEQAFGKFNGGSPEKFKIKVNKNEQYGDYVFNDGDTVVVSPVNLKGNDDDDLIAAPDIRTEDDKPFANTEEYHNLIDELTSKFKS